MNIYEKSQQGFSLIEMFVAFIIFTVGVLALAKVQGLFLVTRDIAEQKAYAANLARAKIQELRNFTSLTGSTNSYASISSGNDSVDDESATYTRSWAVSENATLPYKTVDVTVSWVAQDGASRTINLSGIIGSIDPAFAGEVTSQTLAGGATPS